MGWSNNILSANGGLTLVKQNGNGDLQQALGTTKTTKLNIFKFGSWTKWAKYKFVKDSTVTTMTAARRIVNNQGFVNFIYGDATSCFNRALATGADWQYDRPTSGMTDAQVAAYYPLRPFDFLNDSDINQNGYNGLAVSPFSFTHGDIGIYANAGTAVGTEDFRVRWKYTAQELALTDFKAFNDRNPASYTWYWCVLAKIPGNSGVVTVIPLMTTLRGSTKMTVGSPSSDYNIGYFTLNLTANSFGNAQAYLGMYAENNITHDIASYVYLPVNTDATFYIWNPEAAMQFVWTNINDPRQPSPAAYGLRLRYGISPSGTELYVMGVSARLTVGVPEDVWRFLAVATTLQATVKLTDANGYGAVTATGTVSIDPNNKPSSGVVYLDVSFSTTHAPLVVTSVDDVKVGITVRFGSDNPYYLDPIHTYNGVMAKQNYEILESISSIKNALDRSGVTDNWTNYLYISTY